MHEHRSVSLVSPWHVPVAVEDVAEIGQHFDLEANAEVRAAVARMAGLRDVSRLRATFDVTRHGAGGLHVVGQVSATVGQTCVVTLEPIVNAVEAAVDLLFMPPAAPAAAVEGAETLEESASARVDGPEPLLDGRIDLGGLATEFLILGLDPYPRKPGAVFQPPQNIAPAEGGPFAALAALKRDRNGR